MKLLSTLRGRLFALLAVLGTVTALAVGGATYVSVRAEADALFDYQLRQTALSLRDQGRVAGDEAAALTDPSFDYVVQIWSVQGLELYSSRPQGMTEPLPARAVLGYSDLRLGGQAWRVYSAATPMRVVQVAQPLAVRQKLAALAALRSIVPVAVALPLVAAALWWLIGLSLAPLARVVQAAQSGGANALHALPKFCDATIARVADTLHFDTEGCRIRHGVLPNAHDAPDSQPVDKRAVELGDLGQLTCGKPPIRHRVVRVMGMEREHIPKQGWLL